MVVVQAPSTAQFDGMPRSAIDTGVVDEVAIPEEIVERLISYARQPPNMTPDPDVTALPETEAGELSRIIRILQSQTGMDFSRYRQGTLFRRVRRRMHLNQVEHMSDYVVMLMASPQEALSLEKELLIGVTTFFRDPEAFKQLSRLVIAPLVANAAAQGHQIRAWVCGCATGEEAYSLAILLAEALRAADTEIDVKIFATDIDRQALEFAGAGIYPESAVADIPEPLRTRYFVKVSDAYKISTDLRRMITFTVHNVTRDPPFTKLDLISCRNLLIYFEPDLQQAVFSRFQFALKSGGALFLGSSEALGVMGSNFTALATRNKIFRLINSRPLPPAEIAEFGRGERNLRAQQPNQPVQVVQRRSQTLAVEKCTHNLLREYCPPCVLVDDNLALVHNFGGIERYLTVPQGEVTNDVLRYLPDAMAPLLTATLRRAFREWREINLRQVDFETDEGTITLGIKVRPVRSSSGARHVLLMLIPESAPQFEGGEPGDVEAGTHERIASLEAALSAAREDHQAVVEELETTNEELQATNEELLAANEELQSTNEELQSVNEELYTVNAELQAKLNELTLLTDDLDNLMRSTEIGTVFLDDVGNLRRFTPAAAEFLNVIDRDIGRPITDLTSKIDHPGLFDDIAQVLRERVAREREAPCRDGRTAYIRIIPYRNETGNRTTGAVITFTDVTPVKDAERRLQGYIDSLPHALTVLDPDGHIVLTNNGWGDFTTRCGHTCDFAIRDENYRGFSEQLLPSPDNAMPLESGIREVVAGRLEGYQGEFLCRGTSNCWIQVNAVHLRDRGGGAVVSHVDVSQRRKNEDAFREMNRQLTEQAERLKRSNADLEQFAYVASHDLRQPLRSVANFVTLIEGNLKGSSDAEVHEYIDFVSDGAKRMDSLITDLLKYSRVGRGEDRIEAVAISRALHDALQSMRASIEETHARIVVAPNLPIVMGHQSEMVRLFQNLIDNAIKYRSPDRVPEISIHCDDEDGHWLFSIQDNGVGIDPSQSERVFGIFQRLVSRDDTSGTGIGLAICRKTVRCMGGDIWVESKPGTGSVFLFTLPKVGPAGPDEAIRGLPVVKNH